VDNKKRLKMKTYFDIPEGAKVGDLRFNELSLRFTNPDGGYWINHTYCTDCKDCGQKYISVDEAALHAGSQDLTEIMPGCKEIEKIQHGIAKSAAQIKGSNMPVAPAVGFTYDLSYGSPSRAVSVSFDNVSKIMEKIIYNNIYGH
jgi:hypothetical protein